MKSFNCTLAVQWPIDQQVLQRVRDVGANQFRRRLKQGVFRSESWMRAQMPIPLQAVQVFVLMVGEKLQLIERSGK